MLQNYIKIAFRNLRKNKIDSAISIGGLALGIACCILLVLFVRFEWSFDSFHDKSDRIFRVVTERQNSSGETTINTTAPYQLGPELRQSYPELEQVVRIYQNEIQVESEGNLLDQQALFADSAFFNVFSFNLIKGSPATVLESPDNIVLTEKKARKLFGTTDVIGQTVELRLSEENRLYQVSGIAANPPKNSSIDFEMVLPFKNVPYTLSSGIFRKMLPQRWDVGFGEVYVRLNQNTDKEQLQAKFPAFIKDHYGDNAEGRSHRLQALSDMHLSPEINSQVTKASSPLYSWILAGIALVVLIIACINFMSLSLSRSAARASEVGIRKAAGAQRVQLGIQFLGEALLTCFLALVMGVIIAELALPYFSSLVGKNIPHNLFSDPVLWMMLGSIVLISALLTGLYPAVVLSRENASESLKGSHTASRTPRLVKGLIVIQFSLSLAFLISALIMHKQMSFITQKDLGFEKENVVVINPGSESNKGKDIYEVYGPEIQRLPQVQNVATSLTGYGRALVSARLETPDDRVLETELDMIDSNFLETLKIEVVDGRGFSDERTADLENGALVNRTFVQQMGWENPIGKEIPPTVEQKEGMLQPTLLNGKTVIGVVDDYNYRSLYNNLEPLILVHNQALGSGVGTIWVKIKGGQLAETIAALETTWKQVAPDVTFDYSFLNDVIQQQYEEEKRWRSIVDISALFAIGLACFGLFGLVSLATQRRTKEIGIRKVLGATITNIVQLLSKDFLKLVALGFVIAAPLAYYAMDWWLQDFAYKIEIGIGIFLLAGGLALLIALATVSWQSVKAALANPVDSLRSE